VVRKDIVERACVSSIEVLGVHRLRSSGDCRQGTFNSNLVERLQSILSLAVDEDLHHSMCIAARDAAALDFNWEKMSRKLEKRDIRTSDEISDT
jgi:hypothetical protein